MKDLQFNNGDLVIEKNDIPFVEEEEELQQVVTELLSVFKGEWYFNPEHGADYFSFLGEKFDEEVVTSVILDALSQEPRIQTADHFRYEKNGRSLTIYMRINGLEVNVDAIN